MTRSKRGDKRRGFSPPTDNTSFLLMYTRIFSRVGFNLKARFVNLCAALILAQASAVEIAHPATPTVNERLNRRPRAEAREPCRAIFCKTANWNSGLETSHRFSIGLDGKKGPIRPGPGRQWADASLITPGIGARPYRLSRSN